MAAPDSLTTKDWLIRVAISTAVVAGIWGIGQGVQVGLIEYVQRIVLLCGINIILAVGLNLINGTTGQFSIGHAGFMAVGAYATAFCGVKIAPAITAALGTGAIADGVVFNAALLVGALLAGLAGLAVGVPSLRLKGD